MAQKTRARTLKAGAKFTDAAGKKHGGGSTVHLTLAQEWHFRDQLTPSGPLDPTGPPTPEQLAENEGREVIDLGTIAQPGAAAAPAAPQAAPAAAPPASVPPAPPAPPAGAQGAPAGVPAGTAHPIHDLNVAEASELVASAGTLEALDALAAAEDKHPKHDGGRAGVKRAIEARRAELAG